MSETTTNNDSIVWIPKTNADRIRTMSDEELADELLCLFAAFYAVEWGREMVIEWLKEPYKDEISSDLHSPCMV